ncbi:hypothetical protein [Croceibacterium ferulae]|uniref:hypothetical protein n=1 Tax=Croceibacterium ferulae TaxID=1854641 RepID=UPI000EB1DA94|nr:hypothetical protein [Croceibacterium ferulae]
MLDFTRIIAGVAGQRETFEELVCQIARRVPPNGSAEFRRIHGAGGDGGVEAVWLLKNGEEVGYQAKYYVTSASIDWSAIDNSVETALTTHPAMTTMHIAIACSLTGPTKRRTKAGAPTANGWSDWDAHRTKWASNAAALGRIVEFVPWTAPDLEELLTRPETVGLSDYWFGEIELTPERLAAECQRTVDALEERYHPEDHVDVSTRSVFDGLLHNTALGQTIATTRATLVDSRRLGRRPALLESADDARLDAVDALVTKLVDGMAQPPGPRDAAAYRGWESTALELRKLLFESIQVDSDLLRKAKENAKANPSDGTKPIPLEESNDRASLDYHLDGLRKLQDAVGDVLQLTASSACRADATRFALLDGRAGSGKSHLIASEIERALASGAPALFMLGTDFSTHGTPENQTLAHFEWSQSTFDKMLGALSARAEAEGTRGLVAIDALNEGAGAALWRGTLPGFARRVLAFPNLALCVSCRREYLDHLIMPTVAQMATTVEITGFETPVDVERAARVYMDKRGIVRPATPWLNPEFSNPLFLRTTCLALEAEGRTAFPRGMRGTREVLNFYLTSTGRHLGTSYDGSDVLVGPLRSAMLALATFMANAMRDSVPRGDAHRIAERAFAGFAPPASKTWLETLRFRGLLRYDPDPGTNPKDPLAVPVDVVRFSFQRFGDHLVAYALLEGVPSPSGLFDLGGKLAFLLAEYGVVYEWNGLFYALFLHFADRYGVELIDELPGGFDEWWDKWPVEDAFVDSIRWRSPTAFSERTLELLNRLSRHEEDITALLVELAVVEDHPWNVELLHRNLISRTIAERDAFWTVAINAAHDNPSHPIVRLTDWSLNSGVSQASDATLSLALATLAWCCASTSARIRDTASKAILSILATRPALAAPFFERFTGCDDPYVVERLYAALYGAALRTLDPATLGTFASVAWSNCFEVGAPVHLLARDYARGTIELAVTAGSCDPSIDLVRCRPPYGSTTPSFSVTKARVDARGERVGAHSILSSCYNGLADFGRYVLQGRVHRFSEARLSGPRPITADESGEAYFKEVSAGRSDIESAFSELRTAYAERRVSFDQNTFKVIVPPADRRRIVSATATLLALLSPAQRKRYAAEANAWVTGSGGHEWIIPGKGKGAEFDAQKCKVWVANRALSFGWTAERFPGDRYLSGRSEQGGRIERIGKKYQRIAMMELLARLADNFWMKPQWGSGAAVYDNPLDVEFTRDLEPSIMPADQETTTRADLPQVPPLVCEPLPVKRRGDWVADPDLPGSRLALATCPDVSEPGWLTLYRYGGHDIDAEREDRHLDAPWLQSDFHFLAALLLSPDDKARLIKDAVADAYDFHEWLPGQTTDGPYVGELARRDTWRDEPWTTLDARVIGKSRSYRVIRPTADFLWESHLDGSLPNGFSRHVPIPWLIRGLGLTADTNNLGVLLDEKGAPTIVSGSATGSDRGSYVLVRRDPFLELARKNDLEPIWTVIGERRATTLKKKRHPDIRVRYNGLLWFEGKTEKDVHWSHND